MRDPKRIERVLTQIRRIWETYPDLRLMQLLINALPPNRRAYAMEDNELLQLLHTCYPRSQMDKAAGFYPAN
jgi:hypothetical protein